MVPGPSSRDAGPAVPERWATSSSRISFSTSSSLTSMASATPSFSALRAAWRARYFAIGRTMRKYTTAAVMRKLRVALRTLPHMIGMPSTTSPVSWLYLHGPERQEL